MRISRRRILQLTGVGAIGVLIGWPVFRRLGSGELRNAERRAIIAFVDTLIPADESPGAFDLQVHQRILRRADHDAGYRRLLRAGSQWLNCMAWWSGGAEFESLAPEERDSIVGKAAAGSSRWTVGRFFRTVRDDAFHIYYADPRSWQGLRYPGPPQPNGFVDYAEPPSTRHRHP